MLSAPFSEVSPFGYIIFGRNVVDRAQLQSLTESLRNLHGRAVPILIDQEGGRVARMQPPEWLAYPPAQRFADLYTVRPGEALLAAQLNYEALGLDLAKLESMLPVPGTRCTDRGRARCDR